MNPIAVFQGDDNKTLNVYEKFVEIKGPSSLSSHPYYSIDTVSLDLYPEGHCDLNLYITTEYITFNSHNAGKIAYNYILEMIEQL